MLKHVPTSVCDHVGRYDRIQHRLWSYMCAYCNIELAVELHAQALHCAKGMRPHLNIQLNENATEDLNTSECGYMQKACGNNILRSDQRS